MKVVPLAFESMGVRSSAILIEKNDLRIVIDPAVALAPNRFGLSPHSLEKEAKDVLWSKVKQEAVKADIIVITHYHFDHFDPKEPDIYERKKVLLKHPRRMINPSQKARASSFIKSIKKIADEIYYVDNKTFNFEEIEIIFSKPVPHGLTAARGYVVEVYLESDSSFLYTSDIQGPVLDEHMEFIFKQKPEILIVDGPSTYIDSPTASLELNKAITYLSRLIEESNTTKIVIDHHSARDINYKDRLMQVFEEGRKAGVWVGLAAELLDMKPNLLEARRKELYEKYET